MSRVDSIVVFVASAVLLGVIAAARATFRGDRLNRVALGVFVASAAAMVSLMDSPIIGVRGVIALAYVIVCASTDLSSGYVYDAVTMVSWVLIVAASLLSNSISVCAFGAATGTALSGVLYLVTRGRGLGLGDVKLFGVIGASMSVIPIALVFGAAFIFGAGFSVVGLALRRLSLADRMPFAPYVAAATFSVVAFQVGR